MIRLPANVRRFFRGQPRTRGTLRRLRGIVSPQLGNRRDVMVYLPPSYDNRRRFPVVYMHDGQNLFDTGTSHAGDWDLRPSLDSLARRGVETIVVGVWNAGEQRIDEYSPFLDANQRGGRGDR